MLLGRIAPQILFQPFGEDVPAAGNHQVGAHRLLCLRAEGGQQRLDIADGHPGMVGGMGGEASEGVLQAWGKCLARIALPDKQHPAGELPQARGQFLEMVVFAGDDPGSGQGLDRAVEERLADGDIDMHGTPAVVTGLQQGLVDETVAMPFVFLAPHFGQADGLPDQRAEHAGLGQGLPVHLAYPGGRAVGGDDHQRHLAVEGFGHGGMQVQQGGA